MFDELFIGLLCFLCLLLQLWAFKNLPKERWQILASIPVKKRYDGSWSGVNITYYGLFIAFSYISAITLFFLLLSALSFNFYAILFISTLIGIICIPASKFIAKIVERKKHTFTVGGASFTGIILAPWISLMLTTSFFSFVNLEKQMIIPILASLVIAYAFGEGIGRLACISFGCCYGKPINSCGPIVKRLLKNFAFSFEGKTKKAVYVHGYENERLVPIQAITSIINVGSSICGMYLFLKGFYLTSFIGVIITIQLWRIISEFLRADYRGGGKISTYQVMSLFGMIYALLCSIFMPEASSKLPDLKAGIIGIWNPFFVLMVTSLWWIIILYFGKSKIIVSSIELHIVKENI
ncbi:MAG: prolipoprotein diacylglyceryl transferase [Syntrophorhabdaceae bacterium]|nr:prolipoprotein diacylglyceryl transferase [Syntrophorhabdaceae bacterium]